MSLSQATPNLKSFWDRPEGKTGMLFLLAGAAGAAFGLYLLLPFLITLVANTLYLVGLGVALFAVIYVLLNGTFQTLVKFGFKSLMRWITGIFVEIDPIGILRNFITQMKQQQESLTEQISTVSGAKQQLTDNIAKNQRTIDKSMSMATEANRQQALEKDPLKKQELSFKVTENANKATRLKQTNQDLNLLLQNLERTYQLLGRWSIATQFYINDRQAQVDEMAIKRKAVNAAFGAMSSAKKILRGNADDNALYDQVMEHLAEDASMKLGEMEDFAKVASDYLLNVDLENGAANHDALAELENMSKKLLPEGSSNPGFIDAIPVSNDQLQPAEVRRTKAASNYDDLVK
jgi:hypothetical protein